ncbi:MAG TPA: RAMP superfamily CRISPR-associated protein, partial [Candidatus Obscuribacterales bacterium]
MSNQRLLLLQTHSGLHTGQPQNPDRLSRDPENGRPTLRPASILGALRKQIRDQLYSNYQAEPDWKQAAGQDAGLTSLFGTKGESEGALSAKAGELLLLPVRSLHGVFAWVCSPGVLASLAQQLATLDLDPLPELPALHPFDALCHEKNVCLLEAQHLLLEELSFQRKGDLQGLLKWLTQSGLLGGHEVADRLADRLVLISDTAFDHFMRYAMLPMVRTETRTEARGENGQERFQRLQHVEMLPPNTWLYSLLDLDESQNWADHAGRLPAFVYIGSHRTTGHGLCALSLVSPKSKSESQAESQVEVQPEVQAESQVEVQPEVQSEVQAEGPVETSTESPVETSTESVTESPPDSPPDHLPDSSP